MLVAGAVVVLLLAMTLRARRARKRSDSVARYARAVSALRTIADEPRPARAVVLDEAAPKLQVLSDITSIEGARARRSGRANRVAPRLDPELVARRPLIAQLPSISAPKPGASGQQAG